MDLLPFVLSAAALLATPGPTNTLLAVSGASAGLRRSIPLVTAEGLGYLISISLLAFVAGPIVRAFNPLEIALKVGCAVYLIYSALKLWREGAGAEALNRPVPFQRVFIATLLNPKALIFALVLLPAPSEGLAAFGARMAMLVALIAAIGSAWVAFGAVVRKGSTAAAVNAGWVRRTGAVALCLFAALISSSAFAR